MASEIAGYILLKCNFLASELQAIVAMSYILLPLVPS